MTDQAETEIAVVQPPSTVGNVRPWEYILLAFYLVVMALFMIVAIIAFWPVIPPEGAGESAGQVTQFLFWRINLQMELRLLVTVVLAGALGGLIHCLRSLIRHVGDKELERSWYLYYFGVPCWSDPQLDFLFCAPGRPVLATSQRKRDQSLRLCRCRRSGGHVLG
jgi:hypothetical protein